MKVVKHISSYNLNTPSWDEILNNFNQAALNKEPLKNSSPGFFTSHSAQHMSTVKTVLNDLRLKEAHLYFNITELSEAFTKHKDNMDVYFWQAKGGSKWSIGDKGQEEYILKEGDLIYVPALTYHKVTPIGPRAGISMA
jgi:mannose-6-phosphate isomerase-like protein (cupin superfamily)